MKVFWSGPAAADLELIVDTELDVNPRAALKLRERIWRRVGHLAVHPARGRRGRVPATRELVVTGTPYVVAYRVANEGIEILAVLHGRRRWPGSH